MFRDGDGNMNMNINCERQIFSIILISANQSLRKRCFSCMFERELNSDIIKSTLGYRTRLCRRTKNLKVPDFKRFFSSHRLISPPPRDNLKGAGGGRESREASRLLCPGSHTA